MKELIDYIPDNEWILFDDLVWDALISKSNALDELYKLNAKELIVMKKHRTKGLMVTRRE